MLLTLIEIVAFVLLFIVIAVVIIFALAVAVSHASQAHYVDPIDEGYYDD